MNRLRFFWNTSYIISGYVFTLDDIENGVLRGNRKGPAHIFRQFSSKSDPRLRFALPKPEPLIHFALVCGAKSCPPIKCYTEAKVKDELRIAAEVKFYVSPATSYTAQFYGVSLFQVQFSSLAVGLGIPVISVLFRVLWKMI